MIQRSEKIIIIIDRICMALNQIRQQLKALTKTGHNKSTTLSETFTAFTPGCAHAITANITNSSLTRVIQAPRTCLCNLSRNKLHVKDQSHHKSNNQNNHIKRLQVHIADNDVYKHRESKSIANQNIPETNMSSTWI